MTMTRAEMEEDPNWKNVGNWHWVSKDVFPFAKSYFTTECLQLGRMELDKSTSSSLPNPTQWCEISQLKNCSGDATLSVRKVVYEKSIQYGKLITIYDLSLTLQLKGEWQSDPTSSSSQVFEGELSIPEIMSDFSDSDYQFEFNFTSPSSIPSSMASQVKAFLKSKVYPKLIQLCQAFPTRVIQNQSQDVYIPNAIPSAYLPKADLEERKKLAETMLHSSASSSSSNLNQPISKLSTATTTKPSSSSSTSISTTTTTTTAKSTPPSSSSSSSTSSSSSKAKFQFSFNASVHDVYACFMEEAKLKQWTQGQGSVPKEFQLNAAWSCLPGIQFKFIQSSLHPPSSTSTTKKSSNKSLMIQFMFQFSSSSSSSGSRGSSTTTNETASMKMEQEKDWSLVTLRIQPNSSSSSSSSSNQPSKASNSTTKENKDEEDDEENEEQGAQLIIECTQLPSKEVGVQCEQFWREVVVRIQRVFGYAPSGSGWRLF